MSQYSHENNGAFFRSPSSSVDLSNSARDQTIPLFSDASSSFTQNATPFRMLSQFSQDSDDLFTYHNEDTKPFTITYASPPEDIPHLSQARLGRIREPFWGISRFYRPQFQYSYLPRGHIRVLRLRPGKFEDPIQIDLHSVPLQGGSKVPTYDALSYVWGDDLPTCVLFLRDRTAPKVSVDWSKLTARQKWYKLIDICTNLTTGYKIHVRDNLDAALRHIRHEKTIIPLWVDAICINQKDAEEKTLQLAQITQVYRVAQKVRVWLGESEDSTGQLAMEYISEVLTQQKIRSSTNSEVQQIQPDERRKIQACLSLMKSRWFSRRWIIQEVFFAQKAAVHYDNKREGWERFISAMYSILERLRDPKSSARSLIGISLEELETYETSGANALMKLDSDILDKDDFNFVRPRRSLEYLVSKLIAFDAGDPRDIIFGIHSLALKTERPPLPPADYTSSVLDVFANFTEYAYEISNSLDLICRHWAPVSTLHFVHLNKHDRRAVHNSLPSWIPRLDKSAFGTPNDTFEGRSNGQTFVGDSMSKVYDASRGAKEVLAKFGKYAKEHTRKYQDIPLPGSAFYPSQRVILKEIYNGTLTVKGLVVGRIIDKSDRMMPGHIPREITEMGGWKFSRSDEPVNIKDIPNSLMRTLVAGTIKNGVGNDISYYRDSFVKALRCEDRHGDIHIDKLLDDPAINGDQKLRDYLESARVVCWNRRGFKAAPYFDVSSDRSKEFFGIGPDSLKCGDLICIIYGCSVPVILRPEREKPALGMKMGGPYQTKKKKPVRPGQSAATSLPDTRDLKAMNGLLSHKQPSHNSELDSVDQPKLRKIATAPNENQKSGSSGLTPGELSLPFSSVNRRTTINNHTTSPRTPSFPPGSKTNPRSPSPTMTRSSTFNSRKRSLTFQKNSPGASSNPSMSSLPEIVPSPSFSSTIEQDYLHESQEKNTNINNTSQSNGLTIFNYYTVVGECYVDRYMDGQAMNEPSFRKHERQFTLV